jgi:exopolyphosphatase/guanosine-5'-triphosphate,3'-diphosphate pyrophosphatase
MALAPEDRATVDKLAALLRIADGLDRGHHGNVTALRTITRPESVTIRLTTAADAELELWAARHKTDMFDQIYGRPARIVAVAGAK